MAHAIFSSQLVQRYLIGHIPTTNFAHLVVRQLCSWLAFSYHRVAVVRGMRTSIEVTRPYTARIVAVVTYNVSRGDGSHIAVIEPPVTPPEPSCLVCEIRVPTCMCTPPGPTVARGVQTAEDLCFVHQRLLGSTLSTRSTSACCETGSSCSKAFISRQPSDQVVTSSLLAGDSGSVTSSS